MIKEIKYTSQALKSLIKMDRKTARKIVDKINQLADNPAPLANNIKKLTYGAYRLRVGDYRIIYSDTGAILNIEKIAPRGGVYR